MAPRRRRLPELLPHRLDDLLFVREAEQRLLDDLFAVEADGELPRLADQELGVEPQLLLERGRRTGGPRSIPSTIAIMNRDHRSMIPGESEWLKQHLQMCHDHPP
jgi:hypothetical protein